MRKPVQAVMHDGDVNGSVFYIEAPASYRVATTISSPEAINMLPYHDGICWVVYITPRYDASQIVSVNCDNEQVGFVSFGLFCDGPRILYVRDMQIKHRELHATV